MGDEKLYLYVKYDSVDSAIDRVHARWILKAAGLSRARSGQREIARIIRRVHD